MKTLSDKIHLYLGCKVKLKVWLFGDEAFDNGEILNANTHQK